MSTPIVNYPSAMLYQIGQLLLICPATLLRASRQLDYVDPLIDPHQNAIHMIRMADIYCDDAGSCVGYRRDLVVAYPTNFLMHRKYACWDTDAR